MAMVEEDVQEWQTNDIFLAAFLRMEHELLRMEWRPPGNCSFVFDVVDDLMDDVACYVGGLAQVEPKEFTEEYARLKREMQDSRPPEMDPRNRKKRR